MDDKLEAEEESLGTEIEIAKDLFRSYVAAINILFKEFQVLSPRGILDIRGAFYDTVAIRLEGMPGERLWLQGLRIEPEQVSSASKGIELASVKCNGWEREPVGSYSLALGLDSDALVAATSVGDPPWIQFNMIDESLVRRVELHNVPKRQWRNLSNVKIILVSSVGEEEVVYNALDRKKALYKFSKHYGRVAPNIFGTNTLPLIRALTMFIVGDYGDATRFLKKVDAPAELMESFLGVLADNVLNERELELTSHGVRRSFRYWTYAEKQRYVRNAISLVEELQGLTPYVCLGYGSVLAAIRDGEPIPHDDDLDLIAGFDPEQASRIPDALQLVESFLGSKGYSVTGDFRGHRHIMCSGWEYKLDLFVGVTDYGKVSWIPGERNAFEKSDIFPPMTAKLCELECPVPRRAEHYLETVYGASWRVPDPGFRHRFDSPGFDDLLDGGNDGQTDRVSGDMAAVQMDQGHEKSNRFSKQRHDHSRIRRVLRPRTRAKAFLKRFTS